MQSVPGAVATGSEQIARIETVRVVTRSLPLPVLTSSSKLRPYQNEASVVTPAHLMLVFRKDMKLNTNNLRAIVMKRNLLAAFFMIAIPLAVVAQSGRRSSNGQPTAPSVS